MRKIHAKFQPPKYLGTESIGDEPVSESLRVFLFIGIFVNQIKLPKKQS